VEGVDLFEVVKIKEQETQFARLAGPPRALSPSDLVRRLVEKDSTGASSYPAAPAPAPTQTSSSRSGQREDPRRRGRPCYRACADRTPARARPRAARPSR
jgi:hypothetical protein